MQISDNNKNKNIVVDDWKNNLLIKDKQGKLHHFNDQHNSQTMGLTAKLGVIKDNKEIINDSFAPIEQLDQTAQAKADFAFHPDDHAEIKAITSNLHDDDSKKYSVEKIVNRIIEKQELSFDEDNKKRFTDLLFDFFRNRKRVLNVREFLGTKLLSQQKKLEGVTIDTIISVIKEIKNEIEQEGGLVVRLADLTTTKPTNQAELLKQEIEADLNKEDLEPDKEIEEALQAIEPQTKPEPIVKPIEEPKIIAQPVEVKVTKEGFKIPELETASTVKSAPYLPNMSRPKQDPLGKQRMTDVIKPVIKKVETTPKYALTGPVKELKDLTLENFRRLGETTEERIEKMVGKINLLEQDSFTKKAEGIKAWRQSETYQLYLNLGLESMTSGKEVQKIIEEYKTSGQKTLNFDEFSTISDLNKLLRF